MLNQKSLRWAALCALALTLSTGAAKAADDDDGLNKQETTIQQDVDKSGKQATYEAALEKKYGLTDTEIQKLHQQGLNDSQITIAAQLAKASGKPIDDIVKMRLEQHTGWGKIAKELGVPPREIGQSIASMHRNWRAEEKIEDKDEKHKERLERHGNREAHEQHGHSGGNGHHGKD